MITTNQQVLPVFMITAGAKSEKTTAALNYFADKKEFAINLIDPVYRDDGSKISLWKTLQLILREIKLKNYEYIIVCLENTRFTTQYSYSKLMDSIAQVQKLKADALFGSVGSVISTIKVTENIYWAEGVAGLPFTVLFKSCFDQILSAEKDMLNQLNQFFLYPFITENANGQEINLSENSTKEPFIVNHEELDLLEKVSSRYNELLTNDQYAIEQPSFDHISIPTYIINLPERTDRLAHIKTQFEGKDEFDVKVIEACKHEIGAVGLWESVRKVIQMAIDNDDDVIIIVEDDHEFTANYTKEYLLKNILDSHRQQVELLLGGIGAFNKALPITDNRAWISFFLCTQFVILFKPAFQKILDAPYDSWVIADGMLSNIVINKMVLYPFISVQKIFGYSDATEIFNVEKDRLEKMFVYAQSRLERIYSTREICMKTITT